MCTVMKGRVLLVNNNQQKSDQAILISHKLDLRGKYEQLEFICIQQCEYMNVKEQIF